MRLVEFFIYFHTACTYIRIELYILDQPSRARSPWQQGIDGPQFIFDSLTIQQRFTATQKFNLWPQAHLHTQWPGNGSQGDEVFDSFYRSIVPSLLSNVEASQKTRDAGVALLDKIGVRTNGFFMFALLSILTILLDYAACYCFDSFAVRAIWLAIS